jgi:hypothetical protein
MVIFYGEELLALRPTPKLEGHPVPAVRDCLFNVFAATLHIHRPFLHPQPEDAPCRGDRDPLIMASIRTVFEKYENLLSGLKWLNKESKRGFSEDVVEPVDYSKHEVSLSATYQFRSWSGWL